MNMNMVLQIVLGLIIVIIVYVVTLVVLNIDSLIVHNTHRVKPRESTLVLDGYAPISYLGYKSYNTFNPYAENFRKIGKSLNSMGGAQFTYQFWIKIEDPNDALFKDFVIFMKGDNRKYKLGLYDSDSRQLMSQVPADYVISCPLIKFVDNYRHLRVQFNTVKSPLTSIDINMNPNTGGMSRRNALSLLPLNWYLLTFIFEDNFSYQTANENGINFKFFLNDFPYQENGASDSPALRNNTLKQNDGDLFLVPNPPEAGGFLKIGNIKYFNYALDAEEIKATYRGGPPTKNAMESDQPAVKPPYLTAYNKIDVYNY